MSKRRAIVLFLVVLLPLLARNAAGAETIFRDDFQDGEADGWVARGKGDIHLTRYDDNISLHLSRRVSALTVISTQGYENTAFALSFAAASLEKDEYCIGDVSGDGGRTWHEISRIGPGQDDGVTLHRGQVVLSHMGNLPRVLIRARITGNSAKDQCWLDNVEVTGTPVGRAAKLAPSLSRDRLLDRPAYPTPVDLAAYAEPQGAAAPVHVFEGRLSFTGPRISGGFKVIRDEFDYVRSGVGAPDSLPPFDFEFVQAGRDLIPLRRGPVAGSHPDWEYILEPGRVWHDPVDGDYSRAAIPFALQEKNMNCTHNGVMTFLFNGAGINGAGTVSHVAFQIGSETCQYFKFDMWGLMPARNAPGPVKDKAALITAYRREVASRLPLRPIERLAEDYPGVMAANFGSTAEVPAEHMTAFGFVIDGIHYAGGCDTRYGIYPYCDVLDLPSFSLAKSLVGGLALMRMELLYPGVSNEKIVDYVPQCRDRGTWDDVTFAQALEMTTGHYDSPVSMADENGPKMRRFFAALDHDTKIHLTCGQFRRQTLPGEKFVYQTSATYILGTALDAYLKQKRGQDADLYRDILVEPVWKPLGLSPVTWSTRRSYDAKAQPFTGWGLTLHRETWRSLGYF
tara:strand:- start:5524 stop:7398 length:1875 start_codon:yes stop_codon:yes gene_type:complete